MKKGLLFTVAVLTMILVSCSKDDDNQLPVTYENIAGSWYFKSIIKEDGTIVDHDNNCIVKRDSIVFKDFDNMAFYVHNSNCTWGTESYCTELFLDKQTKIISHCNKIVNGKVSKFTEEVMQIDYDESINLGYLGDPQDCKSVILTRK